MRVMIAAALMLIAGTAWAEGTPEDWQKLAQPTVNDFADCTRAKVDEQWKSDAQAYEIARNAIAQCESRLEPLNKILAAEPFLEPLGGINATIAQLKGEVRAAIIEDVETRRKGN
jgi:hypothetical protein